MSKPNVGILIPNILACHRSLSLTESVDLIRWSEDGAYVACAVGTSLGIYAEPDWSLVCTIQKHFLPILAVAWSHDGRHIATTSKDCTVRVWDAGTGDARSVQAAHDTAVICLCWSPDCTEIASGSFDGAIRVWSRRSAKIRLRLAGHSDKVAAIAWSRDGTEIVSTGDDGLVRVWRAETGKLAQSLQVSTSGPATLALSPATRFIAIPSSDLTIKIVDATTGRLLKSLAGHIGPVTQLSFSKDGSLLFAFGGGSDLIVWDTRTWQSRAVFRMPPKAGGQFTILQDGKQIAMLDDKQRSVLYCTLTPLAEREPVRAGTSVQYKTAKVALVGDTGVGKTGLGTRLAEGKSRPSDSTHGQQFWVIPELGGTTPGGVHCEAVLWDFAGQQDYRLVHSLFLDDVDVALVLFDPTDTQDPLKGVEFWAGQLDPSNNSRRKMILVGARLDRGAPTVPRAELESYAVAHGFSGGYVGISAKTGEGIPELMEKIKSQLDWDTFAAVVATPTYRDVRKFITDKKKLAVSAGITTTVSSIFRHLCPDGEPPELLLEVRAAIGHLAAHGYVYPLETSEKDDLVLLKPDILINLAASMILEARRNQRGLGFLEERALLRGGYTFAELAKVDRTDAARLLQAATVMFIRHNVCFRERIGQETLLVFPDLINLRRPVLVTFEDIEEDATYRVAGETENLYAALVVLLGYTNTFTRTNQWQNQAEYELKPKELCGFQQVVSHEGRIDYVIYYGKQTSDRARRLFRGLFESFLHGRNIKIQKFDVVSCPDCSLRQDRGALIKQYSRGATVIHCANCGYCIRLPGYTEIDGEEWEERRVTTMERGVALLRTSFEAAMVRVKTLFKDQENGSKRISIFISYAWGDADQERWVLRLATDLRNAEFDVVFDQWHNVGIGASISKFVERSAASDFVLVVGTPRYLEKYRKNEDASYAGNVLSSEVALLNQRLTGNEAQKRTVLPVLLRGEPGTALPPLAQGRVYADFRQEQEYFVRLFELILTASGIGFDSPGILEGRESLKAAAENLKQIGSAAGAGGLTAQVDRDLQ